MMLFSSSLFGVVGYIDCLDTYELFMMDDLGLILGFALYTIFWIMMGRGRDRDDAVEH